MALGKLLDYSQARPPLAQVKAAGYSAVYRYVCSDVSEAGLKGKRLTPAERDQILAAGLDIGIHGEDEAGAAQGGYARGKSQGQQWADYAHGVLGAPKGMTIVAAIDYNTLGVYPGVVVDYLHGVRDGLAGQYAVGVYGSIYVVDAALAAKDAVHGVQTIAWSNGKVSTWAHVYQHGGSEFPGTDYNDVFHVPHGTWLQTLGGDDMAWTDQDWNELSQRVRDAIRTMVTQDADTRNAIRGMVGQVVNPLLDPSKIAAALAPVLAPLLPTGVDIPQAELEAALRDVLGSLNDPPPTP